MTSRRVAWLLSLGVLALACARQPLQLGDDRDAGNPDLLDASLPTITVSELALGGESSCALLADGRVACWGADDLGQLASDSELWLTRPPRCGERWCLRAPSVSPYLESVVELELGAHFGCARTSRGALSCWGDNRFAQLGRSSGPDGERHPLPVAIASDVIEVAVGRHHACARDAAGIVRCWGLGEHGRLGRAAPERCRVPAGLDPRELGVPDGTREVACASAPAEVEGLGPVDRIEAGADHTCALRRGEVLCWGRDDRGQLGDGARGDDRAAPAPVTAAGAPLEGIGLLALGASTTFAAESGGVLSAWGRGTHGQLAADPAALDACDGDRCTATPRERAGAFTHVSAGADHACGLDAAGRVSCWGLASEGRLGTGASGECDGAACAPDPVELTALGIGARAIAVGDAHACALLFPEGGAPSVRCWGANTAGQLGLGTDGEPVAAPAALPTTR